MFGLPHIFFFLNLNLYFFFNWEISYKSLNFQRLLKYGKIWPQQAHIPRWTSHLELRRRGLHTILLLSGHHRSHPGVPTRGSPPVPVNILHEYLWTH